MNNGPLKKISLEIERLLKIKVLNYGESKIKDLIIVQLIQKSLAQLMTITTSLYSLSGKIQVLMMTMEEA